jgi:hypothetical protein
VDDLPQIEVYQISVKVLLGQGRKGGQVDGPTAAWPTRPEP